LQVFLSEIGVNSLHEIGVISLPTAGHWC
jgi:hypothetical protein